MSRRLSPGATRALLGIGLVLFSVASAAAQSTAIVFEGEVVQIRGERVGVKLSLPGPESPARGDSARFFDTGVPDLGPVRVRGLWQVSEVEAGLLWLEPAGPVTDPVPGYLVRVYSDAPQAPGGGSGTSSGGKDDDGEGIGGTLLFYDDFESQRSWSIEDDPYCRASYRDGAYLVENVNVEDGGCYLRHRGVRSVQPVVRISVNARLESGASDSGFGLIFALDDPWTQCYRFVIAANGHYRVDHVERRLNLSKVSDWLDRGLIPPLDMMQEEVWTDFVVWTKHDAVATGIGSRNELVVEVRGSRLDLFLNGHHLTQVEATAPVQGGLGFVVEMTGQVVAFDDLKVEKL